jgi:transporter family protein
MRTEFFIAATILGWGFGSFFYKLANNTVHPVMVSTIAMALYLFLLPMMWVVVKFDHAVTLGGVLYALIGSLCMCVATLSYSYILRNGGAVGQTTILTSLYPALTLVLSMMFLGETLSIKKMIGVMLALISFAILV